MAWPGPPVPRSTTTSISTPGQVHIPRPRGSARINAHGLIIEIHRDFFRIHISIGHAHRGKGATPVGVRTEHGALKQIIPRDRPGGIQRHVIGGGAGNGDNDPLGHALGIRLDIDGSTSTNDTVLLLASGASGITPTQQELDEAVREACADLARQMQTDAEGVTKRVAVTVTGTTTDDMALNAARTIARDNLFQCAMFGSDPTGVAPLPRWVWPMLIWIRKNLGVFQ